MALGELVKKYRKFSNMSEYALAKTVGVSHSYINQIEQGKKNNPDNNILAKIALALEIPFDEIVRIKIGLLEEALHLNHDKIIILNSKDNNSLRRKIHLLAPADLLRVEGYIDSLLENYNK